MSARSRKTRYQRPLSMEEKIIMRREKEHQYQQYWGDQRKYYDWWGKTNSQYENWTSPRYYDTNKQLAEQMRKQKDLEETKEKRREKLRKMFGEEAKEYENEMVELRLKKEKERTPRSRYDEIPTEILKEIHEGIKAKEEEKRRKEAELKLYHRWRENNHFLRDYEQLGRTNNLKHSWMHQQMEKRKKAEEERREKELMHQQMEENLKKQVEKDEQLRLQNERRNRELKEIIDKQVDELKNRQLISEKLKEKEDEERKKQLKLAEIQERRNELDKLAKQREIALFNIKQYKLKMRKKIEIIQENLKEQEEIMAKVKESQLAERIEDDKLKNEIKSGIEEFLKIAKEQKQLEKLREKHLQFVFDSEAQEMYEKQCQVWEKEEKARARLTQDVLHTIAEQIENNRQKSVEEQKKLVAEREVLIKTTEQYNQELEEMKREELERQKQRKEELDREVKVKNEAKKAAYDEDKLKRVTEELERAKIEEERLKREIMNLHRGQGVCRRASQSNISFNY